jgi:hypothetical protein
MAGDVVAKAGTAAVGRESRKTIKNVAFAFKTV